MNNPTVHGGLRAGLSVEDIVVQLVNIQETLVENIKELKAIAPQKFRLSDGTVKIWRCPDRLVPIIEQKGAPRHEANHCHT